MKGKIRQMITVAYLYEWRLRVPVDSRANGAAVGSTTRGRIPGNASPDSQCSRVEIVPRKGKAMDTIHVAPMGSVQIRRNVCKYKGWLLVAATIGRNVEPARQLSRFINSPAPHMAKNRHPSPQLTADHCRSPQPTEPQSR